MEGGRGGQVALEVLIGWTFNIRAVSHLDFLVLLFGTLTLSLTEFDCLPVCDVPYA